MSLFIDSGADLVQSIWFSIANLIIAKLTVWVWCGVAIMNGQIVYVFSDAC